MNRTNSNRGSNKKASSASSRHTRKNTRSTSKNATSATLSSVASFHSTTPTRDSSPVAFVNRLFNRPISVPLDRVHPATQHPTTTRRSFQESLKTTTLENGIKITTEDSLLPRSYISISVDAGSRHEDESTAGLTNVIERSIVRSTENRDVANLIRDLGKLGADISTQSTRENFVLTATTPTKVNPVLGALRDILRHPAYNVHDFSRDIQDYRHSFVHHTPDITLNETLHHAAFGAEGLGRTIYASPFVLNNMSTNMLKSWHQRIITPERISIAAVGVDHGKFVALADEMFGDMKPSGQFPTTKQTQYIGKQLRTTDDGYGGPTHISFAHHAPAITSDNAIAANILQMILGGGASFSSGGPGKGMHSRLYRQVLGQHPWINNISSFYSPYSDAGVFGIYGSVDAEGAGAFSEIILNQLQNLATVKPEEVDRAKNMLRAQIIGHYEFEGARVEELARHMQLFNKFKYKEFLTQLDNASVESVQQVAKEILSTPMTVATFGDATYIPRF